MPTKQTCLYTAIYLIIVIEGKQYVEVVMPFQRGYLKNHQCMLLHCDLLDTPIKGITYILHCTCDYLKHITRHWTIRLWQITMHSIPSTDTTMDAKNNHSHSANEWCLDNHQTISNTAKHQKLIQERIHSPNLIYDYKVWHTWLFYRCHVLISLFSLIYPTSCLKHSFSSHHRR